MVAIPTAAVKYNLCPCMYTVTLCILCPCVYTMSLCVHSVPVCIFCPCVYTLSLCVYSVPLCILKFKVQNKYYHHCSPDMSIGFGILSIGVTPLMDFDLTNWMPGPYWSQSEYISHYYRNWTFSHTSQDDSHCFILDPLQSQIIWGL